MIETSTVTILRREKEVEQIGHVGLVRATVRPDDSTVQGRIRVTLSSLKSHAALETHNLLTNRSKPYPLMFKKGSLRTFSAFFVTPRAHGFPHSA
jgi:hypothetical protein